MSQSINLANVSATNFNGTSVDEIKLNGQSIWTGVWGQMTVGGWDFVKSVDANQGYNEPTFGPAHNPGSGSLSRNMINGVEILCISNMGALSFFRVILNGHQSANFFNSVTVNGMTFYTSDANQHRHITTSTGGWAVTRNVTDYVWNNRTSLPLTQALIGSTVEIEFT